MKNAYFLLFAFILLGCNIQPEKAMSNKRLFKIQKKSHKLFEAYDFYTDQGINLLSENSKISFLPFENGKEKQIIIKYNSYYLLLNTIKIENFGYGYSTRTPSLPQCEGTWSYDTIAINSNNSSELLISKRILNAQIFYFFKKMDNDTNKIIVSEYCKLLRRDDSSQECDINIRSWSELEKEAKEKIKINECIMELRNGVVVKVEQKYSKACDCNIYSKLSNTNYSLYRSHHLSFFILKIISTFW
ncbi:hypothetical protein SDC9_72056 [bioreactor metagenome]|uniref:Lipoprotein n=1 Tax=bioreactor metagenome TaxID=1076179 RepID=A0A644YAP2_9ZZZZ